MKFIMIYRALCVKRPFNLSGEATTTARISHTSLAVNGHKGNSWLKMNMPLVQDDLVFGVTSEMLGYLCTLLMEQFWGKMHVWNVC